MMNAITTRDAKIVRRLLDKYAHEGVGGLNWGKYRYHISDIWDGRRVAHRGSAHAPRSHQNGPLCPL